MSVLLDIGANHGQYTDAQKDSFAFFVLVEANPFVCQELQEKYKEAPNIFIVNAIASNTPVDIFYLCPSADQISTADISWVTQSRFTKDYQWRPIHGLKTVSLDTLLQHFPTLQRVKIDVEGYEWNVIQSLHSRVPELCFEWAEEKRDEILLSVRYLQSLGFTRFHIQFEDSYTYKVPDDGWKDGEFVYQTLEHLCDPTRKEKWGMIWAS